MQSSYNDDGQSASTSAYSHNSTAEYSIATSPLDFPLRQITPTKKLSSITKTLSNIIISILGSGVLGLPYAFRTSGWIISIISLFFVAVISYAGMMLLVRTRKIVEAKISAGIDSRQDRPVRVDLNATVGTLVSSLHEPLLCSVKSNAPEAGSGSFPNLEPVKCSTNLNQQRSTGLANTTNTSNGSSSLSNPETGKFTGKFSSTSESRNQVLYQSTTKFGCEDGVLKINSYGDLGRYLFGTKGEMLIEIMLVLTQGGFCVAYLLFIGHNVSSVLFGDSSRKSEIIMGIALLQSILSWMKSLTKLAPFSLFADILNLLAYGVVLSFAVHSFHGFEGVSPFKGITNMPMAFGVAVYAFEGVCMTLSLEASMKVPSQFPSALCLGLSLISLLYAAVGMLGYLGYAENTQEIVTLNLPSNSIFTLFVRLGISFALFFTFPVMMHPVYEVYEKRLVLNPWVLAHIVPRPALRRCIFRTFRLCTIMLVAAVAIGVPHFSTFLSLVGSSFCATLGFVLPAAMHLKVSGSNLSKWDWSLDIFMILFGVLFGTWGTVDSVMKIVAQS